MGIIAVQFFWIRNAIRVNEARFDQEVNDAMGLVVNKLETQENIFFIGKNYIGDSIRNLFQAFSKEQGMLTESKLDSMLAIEDMKLPPPPHHSFRPRVFSYGMTYNMNNMQEGVIFDTVFHINDQYDSIGTMDNTSMLLD